MVHLFCCQAYVAMGYTKDVCSTAVEGSRTKVKKVTIPSEDSVTVTWPIVPLKVGDFPIRVSVVTFGPSETVEKVITVVVSDIYQGQGQVYQGHGPT